MSIFYGDDVFPDIEKVIELYEDSGLSRPTTDGERMGKMFDNSDLIMTA